MGFSVFSSNGRTAYGITNFIVDFPSDIANLSTDLKPGCMAFVMETSDYYMLNHQKTWIKVQLANGGTPIDPNLPNPTYTYVYNGGSV